MEMLPRIVQCSPGVSRLWITPGKRKGGGEKKEKGEKEGKKEEERGKGGRRKEEKRKKKSLDHGVKGLRAAYFMRLRRTY